VLKTAHSRKVFGKNVHLDKKFPVWEVKIHLAKRKFAQLARTKPAIPVIVKDPSK